MGKLLLRVALGCALLAGCRSSEQTSTEVAVDRAPPEESLEGIGGGPPALDENTYPTSNALNVLTSARCQRERTCEGLSDSTCELEAAAAHGSELTQCAKGVNALPLADCAQNIRTATCGGTVALPETCTAPVLCMPE